MKEASTYTGAFVAVLIVIVVIVVVIPRIKWECHQQGAIKYPRVLDNG